MATKTQRWSSLETLQYVAQYLDGTSIQTLKTKTQFLRHPFQGGHWGGYSIPQYRKKKWQIPNAASKIVKIPMLHILITFIIGSAYLWLLSSGAFNYLRHLCTRCPCFFKYFGSSQIFCKFSLKSKLHSFNLVVRRSTQQLIDSNKNNSWKREKQTNQNPFHARLVRVLISESSLARQSLRGQLYLDCLTRRAGKGQTYQIFSFNFTRHFLILETRHLNLFLLR